MASEESKQFLEALRTQSPAAGPLPWPEVRKAFGAQMAALALPEGISVQPCIWAKVPCELLTPRKSDARRLIVYFHGGGNVVGSLDSHRELGARIAVHSGVQLLMIGFRNGPEDPFPAAIDDASSVYAALLADGRRPSDLAVGGDSAGGGIAVALLLRERAAGRAMPAFGVLVSPCLDLSLTFASRAEPVGDPTFDLIRTRQLFGEYLGNADPQDPFASPAFSDPTGLPPLLIQSGSLEGFLEDVRVFHRKAVESGVRSRMDEYEGQVHDFQALAPSLPESRSALASIGAFVKSHWTFAN